MQSFFEFLKFSLDTTRDAPLCLKTMDWERLFTFGKEQAIVGILFKGIERLSDSPYKPGHEVILKFYSYYNEIVKANKRVYIDSNHLTKSFREQYGVNSCVMKGQANAILYPDPFSRTPGDIDMWTDAKTLDVIRIARKLDTKATLGYHHIQVSCVPTMLEIHFFPSFMGNLYHEWKLRKFFEARKSPQFTNKKILPNGLGEINAFTKDVDCVFQLSHLMHHFFFEGIGLRQMIDYYYLLRQGFTEEERNDTIKVLKDVGMYKFARAVMYIMKECLGLEDKYLLMKPNVRIGKILKYEIIKSGNFGFYDDRFNFKGKSTGSQYLLEIYRNLHFAIDFPSETVWGRPISRWWHMIYKAYLRKRANF